MCELDRALFTTELKTISVNSEYSTLKR